MSNISKRESIIVSMAAVTVLFGAYAFVSPAKTTPPASVSGQAPQAADLLANMGKDPSAAVDAYIISLAETEWRIDPFSGRSYKAANKGAALGHKKTDLIYSCYMEMGSEKMAVINGTGYRNGDPLETGGYTVLSIQPSRVVIEDRFSGAKFDVPLKEEKL